MAATTTSEESKTSLPPPSSSSSSSSTHLLAACYGSTVTLWDYYNDDPNNEDRNVVVREFKPHPPPIINKKSVSSRAGGGSSSSSEAGTISGLCWSDNGQVLATCSTSNSLESGPNVAFTELSTLTPVENFSNVGTKMDSTSMLTEKKTNSIKPVLSGVLRPASCIDLGGRSRYVCIGDTGGHVSVWDMKKRSRVRCFRMPSSSNTHSSTGTSKKSLSLAGGCAAACLDPMDKYAVAVSSSPHDYAAMYLFNLREGKLSLTLRHRRRDDIQSSSSSSRSRPVAGTALHFSPMEPRNAAVGCDNGTVLVWDIEASLTSISSNINTTNTNTRTATDPLAVLSRRHQKTITQVAFSPAHHLLLATSSLDGTVAFHDYASQKTIQTLHPPEPSTSKPSNGITSLACHDDGVTFGIGMESGLIHLYDLRKPDDGPFSTLTRNLSITALKFAPANPIMITATTTTASTPTSMSKPPPPHREIVKTSSLSQIMEASSLDAPSEGTSAPKMDHPKSTIPPKMHEQSEQDRQQKQNDETNTGPPPPSPLASSTSPESVPDKKTNVPDTVVDTIANTKSSALPSTNIKKDTDVMASQTFDSTSDNVPMNQNDADTKKHFDNNNNNNNNLTSTELNTGTSTTINAISTTATTTSMPYRNIESEPITTTPSVMNRTLKEESNVMTLAQKTDHDDFQYMKNKNKKEIKKPLSPMAHQSTQRNSKDDESHDNNNQRHYDRDLSEPVLSPPQQPQPQLRSFDNVNGSDKSSSSSSVPLVQANKLVLRQMVEDAVQDLREDITMTIQNLHVDMLRQFQQQTDDMNDLFQKQRSAIENLLLENKELREENERLRRAY